MAWADLNPETQKRIALGTVAGVALLLAGVMIVRGVSGGGDTPPPDPKLQAASTELVERLQAAEAEQAKKRPKVEEPDPETIVEGSARKAVNRKN